MIFINVTLKNISSSIYRLDLLLLRGSQKTDPWPKGRAGRMLEEVGSTELHSM